MTTEFDDELLSAVLDGDADPQTVAAVQADPDASARLRSMQAAAALVATPPPPATPERRAASIAAALAAAQPAPEVSSLSVAREKKAVAEAPKRRQVNWLAVAAAFAFVLISAVVLTNVLGGEDSFDTATTDSASDAADDAMEDVDASALRADDGAAETATAEAAMEEDAMESEDAMEFAEDAMTDDEAMEDEEAMEDDGDSTSAAPSTTTSVDDILLPPEFQTLEELETAIANGLVSPEFSLIELEFDDVELTGILNPDCVDPQTDPDAIQFALVSLGEFAPPPQFVVVQFDPVTSDVLIFDAETCSAVG